jgi:photosystem II stability/assembly factor-like uncharacterized protein
MKITIASPVQASRDNLVRFMLATAVLATSAVGQVPPAPASLQYPLAINTRWNYQMRQEFAPGVHPDLPDDAQLVKGNVLETTVVSEVAGFDLIGGARYARVESRMNGRLTITDWYRLTPEGLFVGKTNEEGRVLVMTPPQKLLSPTLAPGESWSWKAPNAPVTIAVRVVGRETTEVPAGKFETTKTAAEVTMTLSEATVHATQSRWFSPGVGYVRLETEAHTGDRLLYRTTQTLVGMESGQPGPQVSRPTAVAAPAAPASGQLVQVSQVRSAAVATSSGAPVRYEARWDLQSSGATDRLNSVYFIDINTGWAAGANNTILKTADGGKTWSRALEREEGGNGFSSIFFTNAKEGWVQGNNILLHSSDGGETWRPASPLPERKSLGNGGAAGGIRLQTGQFGTSDRIYKSEDGGTTWTDVSKLPRNDFEPIFVLDPQHVWVAGDYGRYALTADGGATWQEPAMPVKCALRKIYFVSAKIGWILPSDHNGGPLATTDGGLTWASQYAGAGQNRPLRDIHFVDERNGFLLVGSNRPDVVYRTADGGAKWATIGQLPEGRTAMSFPAVDNGWVVGPEGYVVHYHLVPVPAAGK